MLNKLPCELELMSHPPPVTQAQGGSSSWTTVLCCSSMGYVAAELRALLGTEPFISSRSTLLHGVSLPLDGLLGLRIEESDSWLITWLSSGTLGWAAEGGSCAGAERSDTSAEIKLSLVILGTCGFGMSVSSQPRTEPWDGAVTSPAKSLASLWTRTLGNTQTQSHSQHCQARHQLLDGHDTATTNTVNGIFCTSVCVCVCVCTVSQRSEYTPHICVTILLYLFMWQHWRNDTLLQCKVVSVQLV